MMYEICSWSEPFPVKQFKFPWQIAQFITIGERPSQHPAIRNGQFKIIEQCWCQDPRERLSSEYIIPMIECEIMNIEQEQQIPFTFI